MIGTMNNVPALRFVEFTDEIHKPSLSSITSKISDGLHSTPSYDISGDYFFINGNNLIEGQIVIQQSTKRVNKDEYLIHKRPLDASTILISINGTIGSLALYNDEKVILGKSACYINVSKEHSKLYVYFSLQSPNVVSYLNSELTGSTIKNLSLTAIKNALIATPSLPEQQKIASFLTAVDNKIQQLSKKKSLLEQYKKGVMQQIFSQKIRFKNDQGNEYPDWEEKKLGEVCDCLDNLRRPINESEREKIKGEIPYWGANAIMGYVDNYTHDEAIVLLAEDGGNFNDYRTRPIANISYGKAWVNNHTHVIRGQKGLINEFLYYSVVHKNITAFVSGGTRAKLTKGEMLKIPLLVPCINEQNKIANFLSAIDDKINHATRQIAQTRQFKKGLLQQMFV